MSEFSVLLPVYLGDQAEHFAESVRSVTADQTFRPTELVIVCDGPVSDEVDALLRGIDDLTGGVPTNIVRLAENMGLARALEAGLAACQYDVVGRADADDISVPERFALQVPALVEDGLDLVGSAIQELDSERGMGAIRPMPLTQEEILAGAAFRDPFNHPSVVYRRSAVAAAGGYQHLNKMEDYWLFARMLQAGARVANLPEVLVHYRVDAGAYHRRGGLEMLRSEWALQRKLREIGFVGTGEFLRNVAVRCGYRLIPTAIRRRAYRATFTD